MRKIISILICIVLLLACINVNAANVPVVNADNANAKAGDEVIVGITLENNTGFANLAIEVLYDSSVLTLINVASTGVGATFTKAQSYGENPYNMSWDATENVVFNGTLANLTFKVSESAKNGTYPVLVSYYKGRNGNYTDGYDVNYDENFDSLNLSYVNGSINISSEDTPEDEPGEDSSDETVEDNLPTVYVLGTYGQKGESVSVDVAIKNNSGFANLAIEVEYDSDVLTLTGATSQNIGATFTKAQSYSENPYNMSWDATENIYYNGTLATLIFEVAENAPEGAYPVSISFYKGRNGNYTDGYDINYDENFESLNLRYVTGEIKIYASEQEINEVTTNEESVTVKLSGEPEGKVIVILYDANDMVLESKICDASEVINVQFEKTGEYIKVIWLEKITNIKPVCEAKEISLN